ncbi:MAG TPA: alpha/beta fold hydrolase [Mycobacteriales bacterium]|nr:alpha/beta fold hydrolase [Mycobacteriales bacterium]
MATTATVVAIAAAPSASATSTATGRIGTRTAAEIRTDAVPTPTLNWTDCGGGFQCATATVPLDYAHPGGQTITLALNRLPASDPAHRIGSLFLNPGGPGGSGLLLARAARQFIDPAVLARFDIVGFDPRGVGQSTPVLCFDTQAADDQFWAGAAFPVTSEQENTFADQMALLSRSCGQHDDGLLAHVTTTAVAEDLDLLRRAVGDARLNYHGYSYGSFLGEVYANLYPDRIRSMVLDGVLDPVSWADQPLRFFADTTVSDERTFDAFTRQCVAAGPARCSLARPGQDATALRARLDDLFARLRANPLVVPGFPPLTYQIAVLITLQDLYSPDAWPDVANFLAGVEQLSLSGAGAPAAATVARSAGLADIPLSPPNANDAFTAVFCTDTRLPRAPGAWPALARLLELRAPTFTRPWLFEALPCATWPARSPERYTGPFDRHTSAPLLLVNTTFDPATSYVGAQRAARRLADARLLTIDGFGHTSRRAPSTCAHAAIDGYLLDGMLPARGAHCAIDRGPFDPVPAQPAATASGSTAADPVRMPPRW